ncbi:MAG: TlpA disulfide reductase family protein [Pseudomonadota bacterium]
MSPILNLGPLALSTDRLAAVAAIWLFVAIGSHRRMAGEAAAVVSIAAVGGFVVARLAYVGMHVADFSNEPLAILKVWQGGFVPLAGIFAVLIILGLRAPADRRFRLIAILIALSGSWYIADRLLTTTVQSPFVTSPAGLKTLEGKQFDPATLEGRPYVINLWADWCPPCRREMPLLAEAARKHPEVAFLFINQGDLPNIATKLPAQHGIDPSTILLDEAAKLSASYGGALPSTIFVGPNGDVRSVHAGEISRAALSDKINLIKETRP